jgi:hypothetical protein
VPEAFKLIEDWVRWISKTYTESSNLHM